MKFFLKLLLWAITSTLLAFLLASVLKGYNASMSFLISSMHEEARADKIVELVTENKFLILQIILLVTVVVLILLLGRYNAVWEFTRKHFKEFKKSVGEVFTDARTEARLIFILPFASFTFFAFYLPVAYDEASTYLNFTSRSPLVSMLYYPSPNNHILHSVITNFTRYIPFLDPLQSMRVSSILASVLTCFLLFSFAKKYYSLNTALAVTGISSVLFMYVYYSFASRGYALGHLFFVLCLYSVYKIIFENNRSNHWVYFSFFGALGFYTMPSFLYPYATLNLVLLLGNFKGIFRQLLSGLGTIIMVAALYLPVIAVNGLEVLRGNMETQSVTLMRVLNSFPQFASEALTMITGINSLPVVIILFAALLILIIQKNKPGIILTIAFVVTPLLLMLLHPIIPFPRTFSYYTIILPLLCVIPANYYLSKLSTKHVTIAVILLQAILLYSFFIKIKRYKDEDMQYAEINKNIAGNYSYYMNCRWYDVVLPYELKSRKFNGAVIKYNKPLAKISADTIGNYDYVIIDKIFDETKTRVPLYSDKVTNVYGR